MRYHNITKDDMLNGDGLRVVLWVSGCEHACPGCQNPVTWDPDGGLKFDKDAEEELFAELEKDYTNGITYTGGDPLYKGNREEILRLAKKIKEKYPEKTQWLYTGYSWEEIEKLDVINYLDIVVDGEYKKELLDKRLKWKGSANQRVIDVKETKKNNRVILHCEG